MSTTLRLWLMKSPRPTLIRVQTQDAAAHDIEIVSGQTWVQTATTIAALDPDKLTAFADGKLLRAVKFADLEPDNEQPDDEGGVRHSAFAMPAGASAESQQLVLFARLLADAYRHATDVAFDRMVDLFDSVNKRAETQEKTLEHMYKLLRKASDDLADREPDKESNPLADLAGAFLGGMGSSTTTTTTNGKATQ